MTDRLANRPDPSVAAQVLAKYGLWGRLATLGTRWGLAPAGALGIRLDRPEQADGHPE